MIQRIFSRWLTLPESHSKTTTLRIPRLGTIAYPAVVALTLLPLLGSARAYGLPIPYASSFEENLFPFWTKTTVFGSISRTADVAYDGTHALKFQSASGGDRKIAIQHRFVNPTKGTVSIAFYDAAPGQETLYEQLSIANSMVPGSLVAVGTMDFDSNCYTAYMVSASGQTIGPNANCGIYPQESTTPVKRIAGWHVLTISVGQSATEIAIDGQIVFAGPVYSFDTIRFQVSGPSWRPDTTAYIDSFSFNPLSY